MLLIFITVDRHEITILLDKLLGTQAAVKQR